MIWQTMMGTSGNPKKRWDLHDQRCQHFSPSTGRTYRDRISAGDKLVIYWPGQGVYMGISEAAEIGPHWLTLSKQQQPHNINEWPYGVKIKNLVTIGDISNGVTLNEARRLIGNTTLPGRVGLRDASRWDGIHDLVTLIQSRAS